MAYKGQYIPQNPQKYCGDPTSIIYRSSWERIFMKYCDKNRNIIKWGSETIVVPYYSPIDGKRHRYFVDFIVEMKNKDGSTEVRLIEIKPKNQCGAPKKKKRITRRYLSEVKRWGVNSAKWEAAEKFAIHRGWTFQVLTENELGISGKKKKK